MQKFLTTAFVATLLGLASVTVAAWPAADPVVGTWKLNVAMSKATPGPLAKSETRSYTESAQGMTVSWKTVGADGKESSVSATYKADGKDYPVTGAAAYDGLSLKRIDSQTTEFTLKKGGKAVGTGTRSVSKDGKVLTINSKVTTAGGASAEQTLVFDRQ
jgi:hypothetical protein